VLPQEHLARQAALRSAPPRKEQVQPVLTATAAGLARPSSPSFTQSSALAGGNTLATSNIEIRREAGYYPANEPAWTGEVRAQVLAEVVLSSGASRKSPKRPHATIPELPRSLTPSCQDPANSALSYVSLETVNASAWSQTTPSAPAQPNATTSADSSRRQDPPPRTKSSVQASSAALVVGTAVAPSPAAGAAPVQEQVASPAAPSTPELARCLTALRQDSADSALSYTSIDTVKASDWPQTPPSAPAQSYAATSADSSPRQLPPLRTESPIQTPVALQKQDVSSAAPPAAQSPPYSPGSPTVPSISIVHSTVDSYAASETGDETGDEKDERLDDILFDLRDKDDGTSNAPGNSADTAPFSGPKTALGGVQAAAEIPAQAGNARAGVNDSSSNASNNHPGNALSSGSKAETVLLAPPGGVHVAAEAPAQAGAAHAREDAEGVADAPAGKKKEKKKRRSFLSPHSWVSRLKKSKSVGDMSS